MLFHFISKLISSSWSHSQILSQFALARETTPTISLPGILPEPFHGTSRWWLAVGSALETPLLARIQGISPERPLMRAPRRLLLLPHHGEYQKQQCWRCWGSNFSDTYLQFSFSFRYLLWWILKTSPHVRGFRTHVASEGRAMAEFHKDSLDGKPVDRVARESSVSWSLGIVFE